KESEISLRREVEKALLDKADFPVPPKMVEQKLQEQIFYQTFAMRYHGVDEKTVKELIEENKDELRKKGEDEIRLSFLLDKIAKKEKIFVTEDEVDQRIAELAEKEGKDPDDYKVELLESHRLSHIRFELRQKKALDFLVKHAKIKEVEILLSEPYECGPECEHDHHHEEEHPSSGSGEEEAKEEEKRTEKVEAKQDESK
ncbi:MAG: hypothetical protein D6785_10200, partial [Planctomycetota bacterium]